MKCNDLVNAMRGHRLNVKFTKEPEVESFAMPGMIALLAGCEGPDAFGTYKLYFDFSVAKEHNLALQSHDWFLKSEPGDARKLGTAFEAGHIKADMVDDLYLDANEEVPFEIVDLKDMDSPMAEYLRLKRALGDYNKTYSEWLEGQFTTLAHPHIHPTTDEAGKMNRELAAGLIEQRIYDAACVVERFEVGGNGGRYCGNGHHFAQRMAAYAKEEFLKGWHPAKPDENPVA